MGSTDVLSKEFKGVKHFKNFIKLASKDGEPVFPFFPFCHVKGTDTHKIEMASPSGKLCLLAIAFRGVIACTHITLSLPHNYFQRQELILQVDH